MFTRWYRTGAIYSVDAGLFQDSDGDGVGDFQGLIGRLDYLARLGVTTIWLNPIHPSPRRDGGYDVSDYYDVHPRLGNLGDFAALMREADERGLRVMLDLVVNHTSDTHPWFQAARSDPESRYRDWYVWSETEPPDRFEGMVFPGVENETWTYDEVAGAWYRHRFYRFEPDLNTDNPAVRDEIRKIALFWLRLGISGFRVDAAPFLIEPRTRAERRKAYEFLGELREWLSWHRGDAVMLAEANVSDDELIEYFGQSDGSATRFLMIFAFRLNQAMILALARQDGRPVAATIRQLPDLPRHGQWATFLRNHDEVDLGRLSDEERQEVFAAFGPEEDMQLYGRGIRRRLAPMLGGNRRRLELAYSLQLSMPGTPVIRYGEEIGMGENLSPPERNCARTPMQWSTEPHGGFTTSDKPALPFIDEGPYGYPHVNVAKQRRDPNSMLNWTERIVRMRKEVPEIGWGDFSIIATRDPAVFIMRYDWRNNSVLFVHNLDEKPREIAFSAGLPGKAGEHLINLLAEDHSHADKRGQHRVVLEPYGYRWYRVGGLDYLLKRSDIDKTVRGNKHPG